MHKSHSRVRRVRQTAASAGGAHQVAACLKGDPLRAGDCCAADEQQRRCNGGVARHCTVPGRLPRLRRALPSHVHTRAAARKRLTGV